ncbi:MAG: hypothetical protein ABSA58_10475 [Acetobacteraceae bacterium]|jgi:hypothetical protein
MSMPVITSLHEADDNNASDRAQTAGLVVGARVPVILTSRADTAAARHFSAAAAVLYADALARDPAILLPETAE